MSMSKQFRDKVNDPFLKSNGTQEDVQEKKDEGNNVTEEEKNGEEEMSSEENHQEEEIANSGDNTDKEEMSDSQDDTEEDAGEDSDEDDGEEDSDDKEEEGKTVQELEKELEELKKKAKEAEEQAEKRKKRFKKGKKKVSETIDKKVWETEADYESRIRTLELKDFFTENPDAKEFQKEIVQHSEKKGLSLEESMKLIMFDKYADEGYQNQKSSSENNISWKGFQQKKSEIKNSRLKEKPKFLQNMHNMQERKNRKYQ